MVKIMKNPIKMDDLGVPLFLETPIYENHLPNYMDFQGIWGYLIFRGRWGLWNLSWKHIFYGKHISSMDWGLGGYVNNSGKCTSFIEIHCYSPESTCPYIHHI